MIITYNSYFILHKERGGKHTVRVRVKLYGQPAIDIAIGCSVDNREQWDDRRQRVKPTCKGHADANRRISEVDNCVSELIARYEHIERRMPSKAEITSAIRSCIGRNTTGRKTSSDRSALSETMDVFMQEIGIRNQWTYATYQKFRTLREHLLEYDSGLTVDGFTEPFMVGFTNHLIHDKGMRNTSIAKLHGFIRWFLRWASSKGIYHGNVQTEYKPKLKGSHFEQKEVIYLTIDELKAVETHDFNPGSTIAAVRDVFVFCCYSGLRFSDAAKLKRDEVRDGYMEVVTKKTDERLRIEMNKHSLAILDRYRHLGGSLALPAISNQKTNDYLKEIGKECGINEPTRIVYFRGNERIEEVHQKWELLTTHVARRTFVVTALQLGIQAEVIMRWTGHSNFQAMKPYIAIVDDLKAKSMAKFDNL